MKKIVLTVAVAAMTMTTGALSAQVKADNASTTEVAPTQKKFESVKVSELPQEVTDAVKKDYEGMEIADAYVNKESKAYKLDLKQDESTEAKTVYINSQGEWIENAG